MLPRWSLLAIFTVAIVLRLVNLVVIDNVATHAFVEDSPLYWDGAAYWLDSGFFSRLTGTLYVPEVERVPLYHLFLIPFRWLFGDAVMPTLIAQALLDSGICVIIARLGTMIDWRTGVVSGLFAAAWPNFLIHSSLILADTLFVFLLSLVLLFAAKFVKRRRRIDVGLAGLFCGLAIMTRPVAILLPLAMMIAAPMITRYFGEGWNRGFIAALILLILSALPAIPLVHRNLSQFGTAQLTSQTSGFMLYWVVGISKSISSGVGFNAVSKELNTKLDERIARLEGPDKILTAFEASSHRLALAYEELSEMPFQTLLLGWAYGAANNLASPALALEPRIRALNKNSFYNSGGSNIIERAKTFITNNDMRYVTWLGIGIIGGMISLALQTLGWVLLLRRTFWTAFFGSLFVLYFLLANGPVGGAKYRLPFEPVLIIFQSVAIVELGMRLRRFATWYRSRSASQ